MGLYNERVTHCMFLFLFRDMLYHGSITVTDGLTVGSRHAPYSTGPGVQ